MIFRKINIDSFEKINPFLQKQSSMSCDFSFGILYIWKDYFNYQYSIVDDCLFIKEGQNDECSFFVPLCNDLNKGLEILKNYCLNNNIVLKLSCVPDLFIEQVEQFFNKKSVEQDIWKDYIYDIKLMASYSGKIMQKKRNHYNKFLNNYPIYSYEIIDESNLDDVCKFYNEKCIEENKESDLFNYEKDNMNNLFKNYHNLPFIGIILKVENEIVGYTIGEIINETLVVHVEKANKDYDGSYPTIQKLFSCYCLNKYPNLKIINREDDAGDEGLKKSKLSYKPIGYVRKYSIE